MRGAFLEGNVEGDALASAPPAHHDAPRAATEVRPGRLVAIVAVSWIGAILCARLLLAGGVLWVVFALLLPVLFLVLWRLLGVPLALLVLALFICATLALRTLLSAPRLGWALLLLTPVLALSTYVAARVVQQLRSTQAEARNA
ncbi:MAG TPA: hypothetical protein VM286_00440 [Candidatus Thermoplasmatota archaeon]|nr:hypothetical protein [Candidatus Thermoplasmatota archaeon]